MTVTNKPDHRGEHEISRNPSRAGMPGLTGELVVTTLVCFLHCTRGCGCIGAWHSPRPHWADILSTTRTHRAARMRKHVIARSPCDEAIHLLSRAAPWIASLRSQ